MRLTGLLMKTHQLFHNRHFSSSETHPAKSTNKKHIATVAARVECCELQNVNSFLPTPGHRPYGSNLDSLWEGRGAGNSIPKEERKCVSIFSGSKLGIQNINKRKSIRTSHSLDHNV